MTAINHAVTGAIIVSAMPYPLVSLPLAFVSHFILDMLPHFGEHPTITWGTKGHRVIVSTDAVLCIGLLLWLIILLPQTWPLPALGGLMAVSPDFGWFSYYVKANNHGEAKPFGRISRLHKAIQWGERPWGLPIEILWLIISFAILTQIVR